MINEYDPAVDSKAEDPEPDNLGEQSKRAIEKARRLVQNFKTMEEYEKQVLEEGTDPYAERAKADDPKGNQE